MQDLRKTPRDESQNIIIASRTQRAPETTRKAEERIRTIRCRQRKIKIKFFSVMRNRLRLQNLPKYSDRLKLDKDLLVLQRAIRNEVPKWDPE